MLGLAMTIMIAISANMMPYSTIVVPLTLYFFMCSPFDRRHFVFSSSSRAQRMDCGYEEWDLDLTLISNLSVGMNIWTGIKSGGGKKFSTTSKFCCEFFLDNVDELISCGDESSVRSGT